MIIIGSAGAVAFFSGSLSTTDILVLVGISGYLIERVADSRGWSRSSKTLRAENSDLIRRNDELEQTVRRHEATIAEQSTQLTILSDKVAVLEARDQKAVLDRLDRHEISAETRYEKTKAGDERRHEESVSVLKAIADNLAVLVAARPEEATA